jgi:hypothetical protein
MAWPSCNLISRLLLLVSSKFATVVNFDVTTYSFAPTLPSESRRSVRNEPLPDCFTHFCFLRVLFNGILPSFHFISLYIFPAFRYFLHSLIFSLFVPSFFTCRSQWPRGLRPLERWDRRFESRLRHGCLRAFILCLCCFVCR